MEPYVHIQGYTVQCEHFTKLVPSRNRICSSKTPNPQTAATVWTSCSYLVLLSGYVGWLNGTKLSSQFSWWEQVVFKSASLRWSVLVKKKKKRNKEEQNNVSVLHRQLLGNNNWYVNMVKGNNIGECQEGGKQDAPLNNVSWEVMSCENLAECSRRTLYKLRNRGRWENRRAWADVESKITCKYIQQIEPRNDAF